MQIGFGSAPQFDDNFRQQMLDQVSEGLERYVGELWQSEVAEERGQVFSGLAALKRLAAGVALERAFSSEFQKVYLLQVESLGAGFTLAGREWDVPMRRLGPLATRAAYDSRDVSESLLALVNELFRPIAEIARARSGTTTLHARGGRLYPPDPLWQPLPPGKLFEVFYCFLDKDQAIERVQQVPWTYIAAGNQITDGQSDGTVTSGLRAPLGARRHRMQTLALGINGRVAGTKLTLVTRAPSKKLLAGVEVELSPVPNPTHDVERPHNAQPENQPADRGPADAKPPRLVADRNGIVSLSAAAVPDGRPLWLLVHSGPILLARVPFVPGLHGAETLELPDDSLRLEVEGAIALVQAKLVDTVARRAVLMALARNRAKAGEWDAMAAALKELQEMRQAASFASEISVIRIRAIKAARARRDQATEQRVQKLCTETLELVTNYLDEEKLTELRTDLAEMRQIELDQAAVKAAVEADDQNPAPVKNKKAPSKTKTKKAPVSTEGFSGVVELRNRVRRPVDSLNHLRHGLAFEKLDGYAQRAKSCLSPGQSWNRAGHRATGCARRREHRNRGENHAAASQAAWHDPFGG